MELLQSIPKRDRFVVEKVCRKWEVDPNLIYAIGLHETTWGKSRAYQEGYILNLGVLKDGEKDPYYAGLEKQVDWAAKSVSRYIRGYYSETMLTNFAKEVWFAENPYIWAWQVWSNFTALGGDPPDPAIIPPEGATIDSPISSELELKALKNLTYDMASKLKQAASRLHK